MKWDRKFLQYMQANVVISSLTNLDRIIYNGTDWVNRFDDLTHYLTGDSVQSTSSSSAPGTAITSASQAVTYTADQEVIIVAAVSTSHNQDGGGASATAINLYDGSSTLLTMFGRSHRVATGGLDAIVPIVYRTKPGSAGSTTYSLYFHETGGGAGDLGYIRRWQMLILLRDI